MALHILESEGRWGGMGKAFGTGIGEALNALADHKLKKRFKKLDERDQEESLAKILPSLSKQQIQGLAANPEAQKALWSGNFTMSQQQTARPMQQPQMDNNAMTQMDPRMQQMQQPNDPQQARMQGQDPYRQQPVEQSQQPSPEQMAQAQAYAQQYGNQPFVNPQQQGAQQFSGMGANPYQQQPFSFTPQPKHALDGISWKGSENQQAADRDFAFKQYKFQEQQATEKQKMQRDIEKEQRAETREARKEVRPILESAIKSGNDGYENLESIQRMQEAQAAGNLNSPAYIALLKGSGLIDIPALLSTDSALYDKESKRFMRGMKEVYGGKVSNDEMKQFLKTLPSLDMNPSQRHKLMAIMEDQARLKIAKSEIAQRILKENRNIDPLDYELAIQEGLEGLREEASQRLREILNEPVKGDSSRLAVAAGYGLGSLASHALPTAAGAGLTYAGQRLLSSGNPAGVGVGAALGLLSSLGLKYFGSGEKK